MALIDEHLPTYTVMPGAIQETQTHAIKTFLRTGVEQVLRDPDGFLIDVVGCEHKYVTKHYGRPLTCDRCTRFQDADSEWKVKLSAKV